jgi:probable rRNA maturation factor
MISFELNYGDLRGGQRIKPDVVKSLLKRLASILNIKDEHSISIAFITESEMSRLDESYYGGQGVTDVLAFPSEEPHAQLGYLGEILIYYPRAKEQAIERGARPLSEIKLLIIHGTLHLLGYNHDTPPRKEEMFRLQDRILET